MIDAGDWVFLRKRSAGKGTDFIGKVTAVSLGKLALHIVIVNHHNEIRKFVTEFASDCEKISEEEALHIILCDEYCLQ